MANFFKRIFGVQALEAPTPLHFKSPAAAFEYACQFLQSELQAGNVLPALVLDAKLELGAEQRVVRMSDGTQMMALRVCAKDGGFLVLSGSASASGPTLEPGDLVAWQAGEPIERNTEELNADPRSNWVGIVVAKLRPEYTNGRGWAIAEPFRR